MRKFRAEYANCAQYLALYQSVPFWRTILETNESGDCSYFGRGVQRVVCVAFAPSVDLLLHLHREELRT